MKKHEANMKTPDADIINALNDELMGAVGEKDTKEPKHETKRNSKDEIIQKIVNCAEENNITINQ